VLDVTALRQMTAEVCKAKATLYRPNTAVRGRPEPNRGGTNRHFAGQNPPFGAQLYYSLTQKAEQVNLKIVDFNGKTVREYAGEKAPGLYRIAWDLSLAQRQAPGQQAGGGRRGGRQAGQAAGGQQQERAQAGAEQRQGGGGFGRGGFGQGQGVPAGTYRVVLSVDGHEFSQPLRVEGEVAGGAPIIVQDEDEAVDRTTDK
jgi:hypothetical protein